MGGACRKTTIQYGKLVSMTAGNYAIMMNAPQVRTHSCKFHMDYPG
jgi:hypothetical protein